MKLTSEQKLQKKARDNLKIIHSNLLAAFSFNGFKTWTDVWRHLGGQEIDERPVTYSDLKQYCTKQLDELIKAQEASKTIEVKKEIRPEEYAQTAEKIFQEGHRNGNNDTVSSELRETVSGSIFSEQGTVQQTISESEKEILKALDDDYGFIPSPNEHFFPFWHQKKAISELKRKIVDEDRSGVLLLAPTGVGKTFDTYGLIRRLMDSNYHDSRTWSHIPYLVLTKSTIVEQHKRVAKKCFNIDAADTEITNIETLRSQAGQLWVNKKVKIEQGEEVEYWEWKKGIQPCVICLDESQGVKNKKATQSKIIYSYTNLPPHNAKLVCISATPFMRVIEARAFAVSTHRPLEHLGFPKGTVLTNENWPTYAALIASPSAPDDYNVASVERLMKDLEDWVVRVRGVRPQFDAENSVRLVNFESEAKREFYYDAERRYLEEKAKLDAAKDAGEPISQICYLVIRMKYAIAAELCHADQFAADMYRDVQEGYAAVTAVKYKPTLIQIVKILNERYGVPRDMISLIWGGGQTQLTKKQKKKNALKEKTDALKALGIDIGEILEDTGLDEVEDRVLETLPEHLRLGPQKPTDRQQEIDKFQSGKSLYCIYTLKAGGVGLSLHHTDEMTDKWNEQAPGYAEWRAEIDKWNLKRPENQRVQPGKCRRKKSGYVFEEDIPFIPTRQRTTRVTVTDDAIGLAQGVGRVPRLTSLSVTRQYVACYIGTVEVDMGKIYTKKFDCLGAIVRQKESWLDIRFGIPNNRAKVVDEIVSREVKPVSEDETGLIDLDEEEEEE